MAELDGSGHCLLPGRLPVTDSKPLQVSHDTLALSLVFMFVFFFSLILLFGRQEAIEVLKAEQALLNEVTCR